MLDETIVNRMKKMLEQGEPVKRIARVLGTDPQTVRKYRDRPERKMRPAYVRQVLEEHQKEIRSFYFRYDRNCPTVQQKLKELLHIDVGIRSLQRFCVKYKEEAALAIKTDDKSNTAAPGQRIQFDIGRITVELGGKKKKIYLLCAIMAYSRRMFAKPYLKDDQDAWLDGMESALRFFGGVPLETVFGQSICLVADCTLPEKDRYTEKFKKLCLYYGILPKPTALKEQAAKGEAADIVSYVAKNALCGRNFATLQGVEDCLAKWSLEANDQHVISDPMLAGAKTPAERWVLEQPLLLATVGKPPMDWSEGR